MVSSFKPVTLTRLERPDPRPPCSRSWHPPTAPNPLQQAPSLHASQCIHLERSNARAAGCLMELRAADRSMGQGIIRWSFILVQGPVLRCHEV
eukprot:1160531-Pelagomonas_calceolata.AAC.11